MDPDPDAQLEDLDYQVIMVRWDSDQGRVIVDVGNVDQLSAHSMLIQAADAVYEYFEEPLVINDADREVSLVDLDEEDEED